MDTGPNSIEELANIALDYLGQEPINSLNPPSTDQEALVARHTTPTRQNVLRKYTVWNFAKMEANIPIVGTTTVIGTSQPAAITGITQALTGVVTAPGHNFANGQPVSITSVVGMTQLNNNSYTVGYLTSSTFNLILNGSIVNTVGFGAYVSGGIATPTQTIPLVTQSPSDWADFYQLPSDCLRLLSVGGSVEEDQNKYFYDVRGSLVCLNNNNESSINIRYIKDVPDFSLWNVTTKQVFALELACRLAYPITKDTKVVQMMEALLKAELPDATSIEGQEKPPIRIQRSRILEARELGIDADPRYYFPRSYGY